MKSHRERVGVLVGSWFFLIVPWISKLSIPVGEFVPWSLGYSPFFLVPWIDVGNLATFEGWSEPLVFCFEPSFSRLPVWSLVKTLAAHFTIRAVVFIGSLKLTVFED